MDQSEVAGCWGDHFWETTKEVARKLKAQLARDTEEQSETGFTLH